MSCRPFAAFDGVGFGISGDKAGLIGIQTLGLFFFSFDLQRVAADHGDRFFFKHREQDHGQDLIHRLFHQDGGFHSRQTAFDAMPFHGDLGRQILQFAFVGGFNCRNYAENKYANKTTAA